MPKDMAIPWVTNGSSCAGYCLKLTKSGLSSLKFIVLELIASKGGFVTCLLLDLALSNTFNLKGEIEERVTPFDDNLCLDLVGFLNMFLFQKKHLYSYVFVSS